ncbi:unnamed protein product [Nezara viridula]|uniref:Uncharacterized protein n=1 Tax=Nezara viridula TaxID=85310 RepID=A0A9P0HTC3_NEZVI|nr:unnamed protein product [Nezara viridula]
MEYLATCWNKAKTIWQQDLPWSVGAESKAFKVINLRQM